MESLLPEGSETGCTYRSVQFSFRAGSAGSGSKPADLASFLIQGFRLFVPMTQRRDTLCSSGGQSGGHRRVLPDPPPRPNQQSPANKKRHPTKRGDRSEPPHTAESEPVQAAGKEYNPYDKRPPGHPPYAVRPVFRTPGNSEQSKRVVHLVARACFEDNDQLDGNPSAESMCPERARRNREQGEKTAESPERPCHPFYPHGCEAARCSRSSASLAASSCCSPSRTLSAASMRFRTSPGPRGTKRSTIVPHDSRPMETSHTFPSRSSKLRIIPLAGDTEPHPTRSPSIGGTGGCSTGIPNRFGAGSKGVTERRDWECPLHHTSATASQPSVF